MIDTKTNKEGENMEEKSNRSRVLKAAAIGTIILLAGGGLLFVFLREEEPGVPIYAPTTELPGDFIVIADYPDTQEDMMSISCLAPLLFHGGSFHPLLILDQDGYLSRQELYTLSHWKTDRPKLLFSNGEGVLDNVNAQLEGEGLEPVQEGMLFPLSGDICGVFFGFDGAITVGSYEESLWTATYAKTKNLAMVTGAPTFLDQEDVWAALDEMGLGADYIVVTNPHDHDLTSLQNGTEDYDEYDDAWFCPDLSVSASVLSAYHDAFVLTRWPVATEVDWNLNMELPQNRRAVGLLGELRDLNGRFGPAEYVAIVGSASAVPQFLMQLNPQSAIINADIIYGFLDEDSHTMDAAVGRIIQFDLSLASNQLMKGFMIEDFQDTVQVDYRGVEGSHQKNWRKHGASFSGFEITYQRMQATPGRWICTDYEDAGFTYDYVGPYNTGMKLADGVVNSMENDLVEICKGSGYVAYRGHGSDYGSLYGIRVYGPNGEDHVLSSTDARGMDVPPQIAHFVSCLNGKIYGHGPGTNPGSDIDFERLFTLNYLAAGPAVLIGATEVSYSNIGQDIPALRAEYGPLSDDHKWDHNDAWYAFVWDGILNHPKEHGTAGNAVKWCENRYMAYPPNNDPTPFEPRDDVDWYEVTFFSMYGDPAFRPAIDPDTQPGYDPWHNGPNDM